MEELRSTTRSLNFCKATKKRYHSHAHCCVRIVQCTIQTQTEVREGITLCVMIDRTITMCTTSENASIVCNPYK